MPRRRRPHLGINVSVAREGGFILVAVLLLIALATVLIVTTSGFSRIESKAVANSMLEEKARQNALYGLGVALAQLQKEAGPDQRVTATAEILNTNSAEPSPVANPFWTGVWKTYNPDWEKDPARVPWSRFQPHDITMPGQTTVPLRPWSTNATNVSWLVSMPSSGSGDQVIDPLLWTNWTPSNSVLLASNWGTNSVANTVYAPLVTLTNTFKVGGAEKTNVGAYAYWVSDEGVKAKISLSDTNASFSSASSPGMLVSKLLHFTAPAAPSVALLLTNYGITGVPDLRGNTNMPKLTTINGLQFVTNGIPAFSNNLLSADLTVHGYGVLCDVRRGGLKQDLTAAFESSASAPDAFNDLLYRSGVQDGTTTSDNAQMAWRVATMSLPLNMGILTTLTNVVGAQIDGMRWLSLYGYYNLYKERWPSAPLNGVAGKSNTPKGLGTPKSSGFGVVDSRSPILPPDQSGFYLWWGALNPIVICQSIRVQLESTPDYHPRIAYYPMVTLYNPYSVSLNVNGAFSLTKNLAAAVAATTLTWGSTNITWPNTNPATSSGYIIPPASGQLYNLIMTVTNGPNSAMAPGEIRVYGLLGSSPSGPTTNSNALAGMGTFITGYGVSQLLQSSPNFTMAGGSNCGYCDLGNPTNTAIWQGTAGGTYGITYGSPQPLIPYNTTKYTPTTNSQQGAISINCWPLNNPTINWNSIYSIPGSLAGYNDNTIRYSNAVTSGQIGNLVTGFGNNVLIASATERLKSTLPARFKKTYLGATQPMPEFMGNSLYFCGPRAGTAVEGTRWGTETDIALSEAQPFQMCKNAVVPNATTMSWGNYPVGDEPPNSGNNNRNNVVKVLRGVPFAPLTSLGQFMHAEEYYDHGKLNNQNYLFPTAIPAMSVGGSFCCPETGPYHTALYYNGNPTSGTNTVNIQKHVNVDNSFLANDVLFDTYFFSTVPPTNGFSWGSGLPGYGPYAQQLTTNAIATRDPLPNPRHVFYFKNGTNPSTDDLQDEGKASANLLVDGAFNVNSTSVVAWKALLTSLNGSSMVIKNVVNGATENRTGLTNPIPRFWDVGMYAPNIPWDGTRCLTDLQADTLAREIVRQVKARGPFLSMGDFLNRRLPQLNTQWNTNHITGALQSAIENTATNGSAADVNNIVHTPAVSVLTAPGIRTIWTSDAAIPQTNATILPFISQIATNTAVGIPGYLMQQDLLQAFAPVMSVRSDTFVIRFYGDSRGVLRPGTIPVPESRVWGEAVVQRLPEYYDQKDPALSSTSIIPGINKPLGDATPFLTPNGEVLGQLNKSFGRRFKLVSLRWLSPDEIKPSTQAKAATL